MNDDVWRPPHARMLLRNHEIDIWRAHLDQPPPVFDLLLQTLSSDERVRSGKYHFERDRKRFIASRGILRMILSAYLQTNPGRIEFKYSSHGKPMLEELARIKNLNFSLSHSAGLALYALVCDQEIGVDLEQIRPVPEMEQIASNLFSHWESEVFHALPEATKLEAFFNCWTRKEAYVKARGDGLSLAPDQFTVSFIPGKTAELLGCDEGLHETTDWSISAFEPFPGFTAALAVRGCNWVIKYWAWGDAIPMRPFVPGEILEAS
jgi:4'-phosphopantetheinyl transferase